MRLVLAALVLLAACDLAPTVPGRTAAYPFTTVPRFPGDTARVLRWPVGWTIRVYIEGGTGTRAATLVKAFETGAARWNELALYGEYELERTETAGEADVVLTWSDVAPIVDARACVPEIGRAVTTFCLEATPDGLRLKTFPMGPGVAIGGGNVKMLVTILGSESAPETAVRLVAHELGHVLGIARHSPNTADLMFVTNAAAAPSNADAATVQILYHTLPDITP